MAPVSTYHQDYFEGELLQLQLMLLTMFCLSLTALLVLQNCLYKLATAIILWK
jgi:hypothetical protein